jgi:ABC-type nitrate/sulfonate/bicarbonate transport system substrate-binding protein
MQVLRLTTVKLIGMLALLALLAAACGNDQPTAEPTPAQTPAATPGEDEPAPEPDGEPAEAPADDARLPELTVMNFASVPYFGPEFIAVDQGFDRRYNLQFELTMAASLGVPSIQAVAAGQADTFQSVAFDSWFKSIAAGVDLVGIMSGQISGGDFDVYRYYVRADSGITGPEDLRGKRMGIAAVGSYGDVPMDLYLREAGLEPGDVERIAVPPPEIAAALMSGAIDVAAAFSTVYAQLEGDHGDEVTMLFRDADVLAVDTFVTAYGFTREFIDQYPERVRAYIAAMKDAVAFIQENPDEAKQIIAELTDSPVETLIVPAYPDGLCLDLTLLDEYRTILEELGYLDPGSVPDLDDHFTNELNPDC